jgi:hypothetical protein
MRRDDQTRAGSGTDFRIHAVDHFPTRRPVLAVFGAAAAAALLVSLFLLGPDRSTGCGAAPPFGSVGQPCDAPDRQMPVPARPGTPPGPRESILRP